MAELLVDLLLYGPPIGCALLYYLKERKKQADAPQKNYIFLYLIPLVIFTALCILWSYLLYALVG